MMCPACGAPLEARPLDDAIVDLCPSCFGVWYDPEDLAVQLPMASAGPSQRACPRDGTAMQAGPVKGSDVTIDRCPRCGGSWLDAGEVQKLRRELGIDELAGKPVAGAPPPPPRPPQPTEPAAPAHPKGLPHKAAPAPAKPKGDEPRDSGTQPNRDAARAPSIDFQGRRYEHYQTSWPMVRYVLGEFPWRVKVGDEAQTRDFVCPPYLLSEELTGQDRTWSHGEYLEPEEVWSAFGLQGAPPPRRGTAPNQPNPRTPDWDALKLWAPAAAALAVGLFIAVGWTAQNAVVMRQDFVYDPRVAKAVPAASAAAPEPQGMAAVTPEFELTGHPSSVRLRVFTNLDNAWGYLKTALIDAQNDTAVHVEREVSYYHGVDDGESWSEGSNSDTVYLSAVPAGRYYLLVDPEGDTPFSYTVEVTRDVPRALHLLVAVGLLLLPLGWVYARWHVFEVARWTESDHPKSSSSSDDDDD